MKIHAVILGMLFFLPCNGYAVYQGREYNVWYEKDAVLYDITQTAEGWPVMVSISQAGFRSANLVISWMEKGYCPERGYELNINGEIIPAAWECMSVGEEVIEHFYIRDSGKVNAMMNHLKSGFTLLIQEDIKVWASNINSPRHGMMPEF